MVDLTRKIIAAEVAGMSEGDAVNIFQQAKEHSIE